MKTIRMLAWATCLSLLAQAPVAMAACLDSAALARLQDSELQYMVQRIPPAFADALNDGLIRGEMRVDAQADATCSIHWQLALPADEIAEAQALLEAEPAKKIMLSAQGYQIPEHTPVTAIFTFNPTTQQPEHKDTLQTAPLGKLRASVELMYAMLTQARANGQSNPQPWSAPELQALQSSCQPLFQVAAEAASCQCYSQGIAAQFTPRQVRYNRYLMTNPYAFATGNGGAFKQLDKALQARCGLSSTR